MSPAKGLARSISTILLLVRPDLHVVWRGNALPRDATKLARIATGRPANRA